jgi:hypothetical protein
MKCAGLLLGVVSVLPRPGVTQQVGAAAGYVSMPGRIGNAQSDHGLAARGGLYLGSGKLIGVGLELGYARLNQIFTEFSDPNCLLPGGGTGTCSFKSWYRDAGFSGSVIPRLQTRIGNAMPYVLAGLGVLSVREHSRSEVRDAAGNRLTNFEFDGSSSDGALLGHLGVGVVVWPGQGQLGITVEGRTDLMIHNYSGGLQLDRSPSIAVGVRWGRR